MSQQPLDLRRSLQIVRRYKAVVGATAAVGLLAGSVFTALHPPLLRSQAQVWLPAVTRDVPTQVLIAGSNTVLAGAQRSLNPAPTAKTLRDHVQVKSLTANLISITAEAATAEQAENIANAVATSYISYVSSPRSPGGQVPASLMSQAVSATGTAPAVHLVVIGLLGALAGALAGAILALALSRGDRRLRERDEIADAIGVPVVVSIPVAHPSNVAGWTKLLADYEPGIVHAWRLRKALHFLGLTDGSRVDGGGPSLAILSLSSDPGALALGPQLAVFAASLRISTALVIGPQQDANVAATLQAACAASASAPAKKPSYLKVTVSDQVNARQPDVALTIVVSVVDGRTPRVSDTMHATTTVLGVSAGAATAEQLARVAVSAAGDSRQIAGILVADPDSADHTTGRVPQPVRLAQRRLPTRLTGTTTEINR
jgi:capsular polysaccharide biosynthesis protein